jgi:hypothetical protein
MQPSEERGLADCGRRNILAGVPHLEQQALPRAAIPDCTNHFSVVNTLRESGFDSACSIEGVQLFGGEFQIQTGEIILELRYLPRSYDRDYWHRLMAQLGECDLRHAATDLFGNRLYSRLVATSQATSSRIQTSVFEHYSLCSDGLALAAPGNSRVTLCKSKTSSPRALVRSLL